MGWTMNDLRSQSRPLAPVVPMGPKTGEVVSAPARRRAKVNPLFDPSATGKNAEAIAAPVPKEDPARSDPSGDDTADEHDQALSFQVSREMRSMSVTAGKHEVSGREVQAEPAESPERVARSSRNGATAPASRPAKRREVEEETLEEEEVPAEDKFPWHHQFDDDGPAELKAKSPLLSRAFRSSVG